MKDEAKKLFYEVSISDDLIEYTSIEDKLEKWKTKINSEISEKLKEPLVILDESLRFMFALSEHYASLEPQTHKGTFEIQIAKIRSDIVAIRELLLIGQSSAAYSIFRTFIEDVEVAMAVLVDEEFAEAYGDPDIVDFWSKYIGYGKIKKYVKEFIIRAGGTEDQVDWQIARSRAFKTYLSSHVHASFGTSLSSAFPEAVDFPGHFNAFPLGAYEKNMVPVCMAVSEMVHSFSASLINSLISKNPPPLLAMEHVGPTFKTLIASAHVLQELVANHSERIYGEFENIVKNWEADIDDSGDFCGDV